jgi:molecular chaperone GrpE
MSEGSEAEAKVEELEEELSKLRDELKQAQEKAEDYLNRLRYLQADFDNYRKRMQREREEIIKTASERVITQLLEVLDNFERALESAKHARGKKALLEGMQLIYSQLRGILEKEGLKEIACEGCLDPYYHEAIAVEVKEDCEDGEILEVLQKGYTLNGKVIRYAKVKVAKRGG